MPAENTTITATFRPDGVTLGWTGRPAAALLRGLAKIINDHVHNRADAIDRAKQPPAQAAR